VKIAPAYRQPVVHVLDASRAVGVVSALLDPAQKRRLDTDNRLEQERLRELYDKKRDKPLCTFGEAQERRLPIEFTPGDLPHPSFLGRRVLERFPLAELRKYIDWTFFFTAWEIKGRYPHVLESPEYGKVARELFDHANRLLDDIVERELLQANAVYGFWPAASDGDDIVVFDPGRNHELLRFSMLRQQHQAGREAPCRSLADFVAPMASGLDDHIGAFAVTAGLGADELAAHYQKDNDDYHAIIAKALADRLAEAFAELLHERVRTEGGYPDPRKLDNEELIAEKYRGIRPAFGYPACPDHSEKEKLFKLLEAERVGIQLTESFAMSPAASVSGIYLAHPKAQYFTLGRIRRDQVEDYAKRKGMNLDQAERWLRPNLAYEPGAEAAAE
jgi:5-methyltetrahydrofolate--homocysteine methyltransferase